MVFSGCSVLGWKGTKESSSGLKSCIWFIWHPIFSLAPLRRSAHGL